MTATALRQTVGASRDQNKVHLGYLDGIRGLAALYIVIHHAYMIAFLSPCFSRFPGLPYWTHPLLFGRVGVDVFIVLSGYCLMLPVVRDGILRGGVQQFMLRRARRILPPYYAALVLCLAVVPLDPLRCLSGRIWTADIWPVGTKSILASHFLLLHNLRSDWSTKIDGSMWTVATEWQIYFVFALLLLPVWKRLSIGAAVAAAGIIGIAPYYLFHGHYDCAAPQFLLLFAFGMAGATLSVPPQRLKAAGSVCVFLYLMLDRRYDPAAIPMDILAGLAAVCMIGALRGRKQVFLFSSQVCTRLGAFSYSLYLIHFPVLLWVCSLILSLHANRWQFLCLLLVLGVPASLGAAYLFHLAFERPFMSKPGVKIKTESQAEAAAVINPAP